MTLCSEIVSVFQAGPVVATSGEYGFNGSGVSPIWYMRALIRYWTEEVDSSEIAGKG